MLPLLRRNCMTLYLLVSFCLLVVVASACSDNSTEPGVSPKVGHYAPPFEATLASGETIKLEELRGDGVILSFWSTWCPPCRRELPLLDSLAHERAADGLTIIAVNMGESAEEVRSYLGEFDLGLPVALDKEGVLARLYEVPVLPMSVFIDRSGVIQYRRIGELMKDHSAQGLIKIL